MSRDSIGARLRIVAQALALPVMRHRMGLNFAAQSEGVTTDHIVRKLLESIPADEKLYQGQAAAVA